MNVPRSTTSDRYLPRFHFTAPQYWLNDPNGLIQWKGHYHMFYQHNPNGAFWGTIHWGHAMSDDLVHWYDMPIALSPDPDGPDAEGCFSGVSVIEDGVATILYTGVRGDKQLPCLAVSRDDDLSTWHKHPHNPVIDSPPPDLNTTIFRDHSVWREDDSWYQVTGSGIEGAGGTALVYRSSNFVDWEFVDSLFSPEGAAYSDSDTATGWECPDFFGLGNRHVLIVSKWDQGPLSVNYFVGEYANQHFTPACEGIVDPGVSFYAPQSFTDETGRRIMFGWIKEARSAHAQLDAGWSGAISLPRVLSILPDGSLGTSPAPEIKQLRTKHVQLTQCDLSEGGEVPLGEISGNSLELLVEFDSPPVDTVEINVLCSHNGEEKTKIMYESNQQRLILDTTEATLLDDVESGVLCLHHSVQHNSSLRLHVFVDHSIVEVFLNDEKCITARTYPKSVDATGVTLKTGASCSRARIDAWSMSDSGLD